VIVSLGGARIGPAALGLAARGRDEIIEDFHHLGRARHLGKVPDVGKHLEPTPGPGGVRGMTMVDRDDAVPLAPNRQRR
jgi:hypothetical protein